MSTWRHMWPEVSWPSSAAEATTPKLLQSGEPSTLEVHDEQQKKEHKLLVRRNEHMWNNTKWRDIRGVLQGAYVQWFGLEVMHWFVFLRYGWYPPNWFQMPVFPEKLKDGKTAAV
ncbi:Hypothetical protein, putative [Bodo saltans]|uniref:Uncharacterized protein n=1 Tax=Bodo saltans TaxID=75058 RepID=A0A0S4IIA7_BODSA|nr:Hypothetical protein, putative [Bodo saltans]|eukprot:CUE71317.1 Hypothetical protein, putative [Bodo saltans]